MRLGRFETDGKAQAGFYFDQHIVPMEAAAKAVQGKTDRKLALGEGDDLRLSGKAMTGGALLAEGRIVHLAAFDIQGGNKRGNHRARRYYDGPLH